MDIEATAKELAEKGREAVIQQLMEERVKYARDLAEAQGRCMNYANKLDYMQNQFRQLSQQAQELEKKLNERIKNQRKEIRFMRGRHEILSREYHAVCRERDTLNRCVTILEGVLLDEQSKGGTPQGTETPAKG